MTSRPPDGDGSSRTSPPSATTSSRTIASPRPKWPLGRPSRPRRRRLPETVERAGALVFGHARTFVTHPELDPVVAVGRGEPDRAAFGRDFERVVEEVVDDLLEPTRCGAHELAPANRRLDQHVPFGGERVPRVTATVEELVDRDRRRDGRRLLGAREREQPVDQTREPPDFGERAVEVVGGLAAHIGFEVLESEPEGCEWCAQLMGRVGDERALAADELFEARRGGVERLGEDRHLARSLGHGGAHRQIAPTELFGSPFELLERPRHGARQQEAGQEHDAEHDATRRRQQQPDVADARVDHRRGVRDAHRALDARRRTYG